MSSSRRLCLTCPALLCIAITLFAARSAYAQRNLSFWSFKDQPYYEPLKADPRAAKMQLIVPAWAKEFPHSETPGNRFAWQITLGRELPIIGWHSDTSSGRVGKGKLGFGFWVPVSFHMIEDFKDESNPIVDTDYRFGFMSKFQYGLGEQTWLGVRFTPWAHESTHLGDEYVIIAQGDPAFERVNPSFEYYEYGVSVEHVFGDDVLLIARHGGINLHGSDGYYSNHLLGSEVPTITPSAKNYEPSFGVELRGPEQGDGRHLFVSVDARHKLQYEFHRAAGQEETKHLSWSVAIGRSVSDNKIGVPLREYFFHFYKGVNPYGQLRVQSDFWSAGAGFTFGI